MVDYISKKLTINFENQDVPGELYKYVSISKRIIYISSINWTRRNVHANMD